MKKNISCPCGRNFPVEVEEEIDLDTREKVLESIFNGTFMSYDCPSCMKIHKPEFRIILFWKSKNFKLEVIPELDRGAFYLNKKEKQPPYETVIGFPEMADRLAVVKADLEPTAVEALKSYLLAKAEENYPGKDIFIWYHCKTDDSIEFHIQGIKPGEVAVTRIPRNLYDRTLEDFKKHPKKNLFASLRVRSYMSVQNLLRPEAFK